MKTNITASNGHESTGLSATTAFIAGALGGAAVALLWAPARGRETRTYLKDTARAGVKTASNAARSGRKLIDKQTARVSQAAKASRKHFGRAGEHAAHAAATGRDASKEIIRDGNKVMNEVTAVVREGRNAAADVAGDLRTVARR